jgi:hypothetical protein
VVHRSGLFLVLTNGRRWATLRPRCGAADLQVSRTGFS